MEIPLYSWATCHTHTCQVEDREANPVWCYYWQKPRRQRPPEEIEMRNWERIEHVQRDLESQEGQAISYNRIHLPAHNISGGCNCATSTNPGVNQPMRSLHFPWIARGFVQLSKIMLRQWWADLESLNYRGYAILWLSACGTFGCMFHQFPKLCFVLEKIWDHIYNIIVY